MKTTITSRGESSIDWRKPTLLENVNYAGYIVMSIPDDTDTKQDTTFYGVVLRRGKGENKEGERIEELSKSNFKKFTGVLTLEND